MEQTPLILATENSIFEFTHIFGDPIQLYRSTIHLTGMLRNKYLI